MSVTKLQCDACGKKYKTSKPYNPNRPVSCKACSDGKLHPVAAGESGLHAAAPFEDTNTFKVPMETPSDPAPAPASKPPPQREAAPPKPAPEQPPEPTSPAAQSPQSAVPSAGTDASDQEMVEEVGQAFAAMKREISKKIVGQHEVVENVLTCIFASGHCLLLGVPGLAKTLLVNSIAQALGVNFKRIQFTPDLMPSDITGTDIIQEDPDTGRRSYTFLQGPIFTNILLADEINRTPPKTQAALLEAMQEKQVSAGGTVYSLDKPFFVMATQNPLDQEGTYPLPEAQMDRFLFNIFLDYPGHEDEMEIARVVTGGISEDIVSVVSSEQIQRYQTLIRRVPVTDHVLEYAVRLVRMTRQGREEAPDFVNEWMNVGAGPRASLALISAAKARAVLHGRFHVAVEDVRAIANPVLRHRISPNFGAQAEGINSDILVEKLVEAAGE